MLTEVCRAIESHLRRYRVRLPSGAGRHSVRVRAVSPVAWVVPRRSFQLLRRPLPAAGPSDQGPSRPPRAVAALASVYAIPQLCGHQKCRCLTFAGTLPHRIFPPSCGWRLHSRCRTKPQKNQTLSKPDDSRWVLSPRNLSQMAILRSNVLICRASVIVEMKQSILSLSRLAPHVQAVLRQPMCRVVLQSYSLAGSSRAERLSPSGAFKMSSSCPQQDLLRDQYLHAVNAYGEAIGQQHSHRCSEDQEARRLTKQREEACRSALRALKHHVTEHGCDADREVLSLHAVRDRVLSSPALRRSL